MRLLDGGSLLDYTGTEKPLLPLIEVATITRHLASALQYAHGRNVIHRDVKASNVMFDEQGTVFLVDFGIAQIAGTTSDLSMPGHRVGTPDFMAPEQWRSEELTPAVDQYALAILVYHMLTGQLPFNGEMPHQLRHSHLNDFPIPLNHWRDDLPAGALMPVLNRALQKDPAGRYADVDIFARAFENALQSAMSAQRYSPEVAQVPQENQPRTLDVYAGDLMPSAYRPERRRRRRRSPWRYGIVLLLLALLSVVAFVLVSNFASPPDNPNIVSALEVSPSPDASSGSATAQAILALLATETPSATPSESPTSTPSDTPTITPTPPLPPVELSDASARA
jgi:serine/threonine-protein kinase